MAQDNEPDVRSLAEAELHVQCLYRKYSALERQVRDHDQRFDTLQTVWWKRAWFRIDGWPGIRDLNAPRRRWRPWHKGR